MQIFVGELSKTISFLLVQIAQMRAATPVNKRFLILWPIPLAQSSIDARQIEAFEYYRLFVMMSIKTWQSDNKKIDVEFFLIGNKNTLFPPL
jgi:hypothetical protein